MVVDAHIDICLYIGYEVYQYDKEDISLLVWDHLYKNVCPRRIK